MGENERRGACYAGAGKCREGSSLTSKKKAKNEIGMCFFPYEIHFCFPFCFCFLELVRRGRRHFERPAHRKFTGKRTKSVFERTGYPSCPVPWLGSAMSLGWKAIPRPPQTLRVFFQHLKPCQPKARANQKCMSRPRTFSNLFSCEGRPLF